MRLSERSLGILLGVMLAATAGAQQGPALTLSDCLAEALNANPRMAAALARVSQAEAGVDIARAAAEPVINLTISGRLQNPVQSLEIPIPGAGTVEISRADQASANIGVAWPVWTGGRVRAATGAAKAGLSASEADLQQATEQLLYETAVAYYDLLRAQAGRAEAGAAQEGAVETLRTVGSRREAGMATSADVRNAEAAVDQANQRVLAAANAIDNARDALSTLLDRPLGSELQVVAEPFRYLGPGADAEALDVALVTRPELLALDRRGDVAEAAIAQARALRKPTLAAVAQAGLQTPTATLPDHNEFIGFEFSWPILHHPASHAQEHQAKASVREVEATRQELEAAVTMQVAESARYVTDADETVAALTAAAEAADSTNRATGLRYTAGVVTFQQATAASTQASVAHARLVQADAACSIAHLSRVRALGLMRTLILIDAGEGPQQ